MILGLFSLYILGSLILIIAIKLKKVETKKHKITYLLYASLVICVASTIIAIYNNYLYWNTKEFNCSTFTLEFFSIDAVTFFYVGISSIALIFTCLVFWVLRLRKMALLSLVIASIISFTSIVSIDKFENEWNTREKAFCSTPEQVKKTQIRQKVILMGVGLLWGVFKYKELQDK